MKMRSLLTSTFGILFVLATTVSCYNQFQQSIPNGEMVPHPCKPNYLWRGVGHENHLGGGDRNPFGRHFSENNFKWTVTLCRRDSDGDGKTNGEELGDPDCTWTTGTKPLRSTGLSHPGICDPFDSPSCNGHPSYVDCDYLDFKCDTINEEGVFNFTVRLPESPVPTEVTTNMCVTFEFPTTENGYHIVANTPVIDNADVLHHMVMFGCTGDVPMDLNAPYACGMSGNLQCVDIIGGWTVGLAGVCRHKDVGVLVGGAGGYTYAILQSHWNNPMLRADYTDSSGMNLYLTPNPRPYNMDVIFIGQYMLNIPPGRDSHEEHGGCSSACTSRYLVDNITIIQVRNHMHYLGKAQFTTLQRRNGETVEIGMDEAYSYNSPGTHLYEDGIVMRSGDELATTCVYSSTSRHTTTFQGDGTSEEMCYSFITYYPKENMKQRSYHIPSTFGKTFGRVSNSLDLNETPSFSASLQIQAVCIFCGQSLSADFCRMDDGNVNGCNFTARMNQGDSKTAMISTKVLEYCTPGFCRIECKNYVREVKRDPCYSGDVGEWLRKQAMKVDPRSVYWYAAFDSCDVQILKDQFLDGTSSVPAMTINLVLVGNLVVLTMIVWSLSS